MSSLLIHDMELPSLIIRLVGVFAVTYAAFKYVEAKRSPLNAIPTIGHSGVFSSYISAFHWIRHGADMIQEGYDRYPNRVFKIANISRWIVIANGRQLLDDVRKAPDDVLSFEQAVNESIQSKYTFGEGITKDPYHTGIVQSSITRNLATRFDDIRDEIVESFQDYIPAKEDWVSVPAHKTMMHIVCRVSNRYFVGLPMCRHPGYRALNERYTLDVMISARILNCFPNFLKPLVGRYMTPVPKSVRQAAEYLGPTIQERLDQEEQHGPDWPGRPNDLISWLLDIAQGYQRSVEDIAMRIISLNFAAIHTSSMTFTQALFDLAVHPEYVKEMREEAEAIIGEHGWTKAGMQKMRKVDSFLKESQRLHSIGTMLMSRKTLKDWTMSDGTFLPAGTYLAMASAAMNTSEQSFPDAHTFKGFRFSDMRDGDGELDSIKHQMVSLGLDHIVFGHGRHACPGRFFAVNEIKAMLAYVILNYDVQLEGGSLVRPQSLRFAASVVPDMKTNVLFRKRAAA